MVRERTVLGWMLVAWASWAACAVSPAHGALDPPHDVSRAIDCAACHIAHHAVGGAITRIGGNSNLCISCHSAGGVAAASALADGDQAIPGEGGTSHRWDSGASGWVKKGPANTSTGAVQSTGAFTGRYRKTYTITVTGAGDVGGALFAWTTSTAQRQTYLDGFPALSYNGSTGTQDWSTSAWQEIGEADGVGAGVVRVVAGAACAGGNCLRVGGGLMSAINVARAADLHAGTAAMLTFSYRRQLSACPKTSTAGVVLQVSANGAPWTTLATYMLNACDAAQVAQAFDVTPYIAATTSIRFLGTGTAGATDFLYVDDVQLENLVTGGGPIDVPVAAAVSLDEGIGLAFGNGATSPSFKVGDQWTVYVNPDVNQPTTFALTARLADGKVTCSTCHNEHSQLAEPFDPSAPPYPATGPGGEGRHNQRLDNDIDQMCADCHGARNVTTAQSSHPVGIAAPATSLPLDKTMGMVRCSTCHDAHFQSGGNGMLLRGGNVNALCSDCHTLADTTSPAAHLSPSTGVLWPGPQYGTLFPRVSDTSQRGLCTNCHQAHGWPDQANVGQDYPSLLVNREEKLCFACHDGSPVAKNVRASFTKSYRHPTTDYGDRHTTTEGDAAAAFGTSNRHAECADCHDSHVARADASPPLAPAASNRIRGVSRVAVTNGAAGTVPAYTYRGPTDTTGPVAEYQLCFKCHSSWTTRPAGQSDLAVRFNTNNPSFHPVEGQGKNLNIRTNSFVAGWNAARTTYCTDCHTSDDVGVRGPHGSQYRYLLKRPYVASGAARTTASTEACFDCHTFATYGTTQSSDTVLGYSRFNRPGFEAGHSLHVQEKRAPCYACHDSHGSSTQPHLIVTGRNPGLNSYTETATGGSCSPTCHTPRTYTINYAR